MATAPGVIPGAREGSEVGTEDFLGVVAEGWRAAAPVEVEGRRAVSAEVAEVVEEKAAARAFRVGRSIACNFRT